MNSRDVASQIFSSAIRSVQPGKLIQGLIRLEGESLLFGGLEIKLRETGNIWVIGAGKATAHMALAIEKILGSRITGGHIVVKYGHSVKLKHIGITEAGHPIPDHNGFVATRKIQDIALKAGKDDLVICLISGGGSALLADYPEGSAEEDIVELNDLLVNCGAGIHEINTVRKHLSSIKGGQLARSVFPASLVNLMLSDVPGDDPGIIASGPASPDYSAFSDALEVIRKYRLEAGTPVSLLAYLEGGMLGLADETPKPGDPIFIKCHNILIGNNLTALKGAMAEGAGFGLNTVIADADLCGSVDLAADHIVSTSMKYRNDIQFIKPACLLFGGETTVKVASGGKGGRNQHLALKCASLISGVKGITVLAGGTDGTDGPTDAAGAVVDGRTLKDAENREIDLLRYTENFDSYNFFSICGGHIVTGPTGTNVMDIAIVILE